MTGSAGGIDAPATIDAAATSFEIQVDAPGSRIHVEWTDPDTSADYTVGDDGKVTINVPRGVQGGSFAIISDLGAPPNTATVEVVSSQP